MTGTKDVEPPRLEREIDSIRGDLDVLVRELDRRRHDALDWRLQVRRHQRDIAIAAGVVGAGLLGIVWWSVRRRRARDSDLVRALRLVARHPDALARAVEQQQPSSKVAAASAKVAGAAIPVLARGLLRGR